METLYCLSNPSMSGLYKIGRTSKTPEERAAQLFTTGVPEPFVIEFAKKVNNAAEKERDLHRILEEYYERMPGREFFRVPSVELIRAFFDLMDGEPWVPTDTVSTVAEYDEYDEAVPSNTRHCRDISQCFVDGQLIRHRIGINTIRIGKYDSSQKGIVFEGKVLSLNQFASTHYARERPNRTPAVNAWMECDCEVDGKWMTAHSQRPY